MHRQEGGRHRQRETEGVKAKVHTEGRGMETGKEGEEGREGERTGTAKIVWWKEHFLFV